MRKQDADGYHIEIAAEGSGWRWTLYRFGQAVESASAQSHKAAELNAQAAYAHHAVQRRG